MYCKLIGCAINERKHDVLCDYEKLQSSWTFKGQDSEFPVSIKATAPTFGSECHHPTGQAQAEPGWGLRATKSTQNLEEPRGLIIKAEVVLGGAWSLLAPPHPVPNSLLTSSN